MNIFDFTYEKLVSFLEENNFRKFNADQIFDWIYKKRIFDYNKMSNISKELILFLEKNIKNTFISIEEVLKSDDVRKFDLFGYST